MSQITLFSRQGCHLCEQAQEIITRVAGSGHQVTVIDIDTDPALVDAYTVRVPVIEVDGREIAQYQVDEYTLRNALPE